MSDEIYQCKVCNIQIVVQIPEGVNATDLSILINVELSNHLAYMHPHKIYELFEVI